MADKLMRAQVTIPMDSAIPADYVTNTFYFDGDDGATDSEYHDAVQSKLDTFYHAIDDTVFPESVNGPAILKIYDMRDPLPREPEYTSTITLTPSVNRGLPNEVAVVLSFQANAVSGLNQRRRRGRIYLGPIATSVLTTDPGPPRVSSSLRTLLAGAAHDLITPTGVTGGSVSWSIYSPTTDATDTIDNAFNDAQNGWIDDAFDTQRRRGVKASTRTTFS